MTPIPKSFQKVATALPTVIAITILTGTVGLYFTNYSYLLIYGIHLTLGAIIYLSILYLTETNNNEELGTSQSTIEINQLFQGLTAAYIVIFAIATLLIALISTRPHTYFGLVTVLYLIITLQIMQSSTSDLRKNLILFELILVHLNLVYSFSLKYYYSFNRVDVLVHARHVTSIVKTGEISGIIGIYEDFPLWHILATMQHIITAPGWEIWKTLFVIGGITGLVAILGSYSLADYLSIDKESPLYIALFVSASPTVVFYSSYSIPRSTMSPFIVITLLLFLKINDVRNRFLLLTLITSIIIYHPSSPPFLLLILFGITVLTYIYRRKGNGLLSSYVSISILAFVLTIFYWGYQSNFVIAAMAELLFVSTPEGAIRTPSLGIPLIQVFDQLYYAPLLALICISIKQIYDKRTKLSGQLIVFSVLGLVFFSMAVPGPVSLITRLLRNFSFTRLELYVYPFILLLAGFGFSNILSNNRRLLRIAGIGILLFLLIPAIFGSVVAPDNPVTATDRSTGYLTESEVTAFDSIIEFSNQEIYTDYVTRQYFQASSHRDRVHMIEYNRNNERNLRDHDGIIIYRQRHATERSIQLDAPQGQRIRVTAADLDHSITRHNKVYSAGSVVAFK